MTDTSEQIFTCGKCGMVSHHPKDAEHGYCGNCHEYTGKGWRWELWPMTFGKYRLVLTDGLNATDFYCMKDATLGVMAQVNMINRNSRPTEGYTRKCVDGQIYYPAHDFRHSEHCVRCSAAKEEENGECAPGTGYP